MERLKRLRTEKGLSQARLAARAELDPSTVNQIERGAREASPATLRKLADALEVGLYDLLEEASPKTPSSSPIAAESNASEERNSEDAWKAEYLALAGEMLDKWEDELDEKLALAESDPVRFFEWLEGVRAFGRPLMSGVLSGYTATSVYRLEAIARAGAFLDPWRDLWLRIEEVTTLTEEDQKRLLEVSEDARRPVEGRR